MKALVAAIFLWPALVAAQSSPPPPPPASDLPYVEAKPVPGEPAPTPPPPPPASKPEGDVASPPPADKSATEPVAPPPPPVTGTLSDKPAAEQPSAKPADPNAPPPPVPVNAPAGSQPAGLAPPPPPLVEPPTEFVKGELTSLGVDRLITKRSRVMASVGYNHIGETEYVLVYPQFSLKFGDFAFGLGAPINIEIFSSAYPRDPAPGQNHIAQFSHAGTIRKEDWDEPSDFARLLTFLSYGKKEDHFYLDVGQQHAVTIGHGTLMRRYNGNIDVGTYRGGAEVDAYNDYAGVEFMTNDVVMWHLMSALAFIKPLSFFLDHWFPKSVSLGVTAAFDRDAPTRVLFMNEPSCPVAGACLPANVPQVDDHNRLVTDTSPILLGGIDLEAKIVKTENVDIKPFIDYSRFFLSGLDGSKPGGGFTAGVLGRFNVGKSPTHAFRLIAELRVMQEGYRAGYFDTFYEVDKFLWMGTGGVKPNSGGVPKTKLQTIVGDATTAPIPGAVGYYFEVSYGIRDAVGLTFALEGNNTDPGKNFVAHLEVPVLSWLQVFGTIYVRGFDDFGTIFKFDDHTVAFAGIRIKPLPILFINLRAYKTFDLDAYSRGTSAAPLGTMQYQNVFGFAGDIGFGWEF